ncbi:hypothetical protein Syun_009434 [Stephania yunnanensis]|uniref:Uncharacterized protein n=1 Tax=Stephania yunnanensis TaxID=152371 RepID=A0AAP0KH46_9MAGN
MAYHMLGKTVRCVDCASHVGESGEVSEGVDDLEEAVGDGNFERWTRVLVEKSVGKVGEDHREGLVWWEGEVGVEDMVLEVVEEVGKDGVGEVVGGMPLGIAESQEDDE